MMQAAKYGFTLDRASIDRLGWTWNGSIFLKLQVCSRLMVVGEVLLENPSEVAVVQYDNVVQAFSTD